MTADEITCITCPYFRPGNADNPQMGGQCRRMPPTPVFVGHQEVPALFNGGVMQKQLQPIVLPYYSGVTKEDYCGEHPVFQQLQAQALRDGIKARQLKENAPTTGEKPALPPVETTSGEDV